MERISTYTIAADTDTLRETFLSGRLASSLREPFQAIVHRVSGAASTHPVSIYVCATDADVERRNYFAAALARVVLQHVPSTLVVDCDFLNPGLSGLVPERDALGFLDLLLYGSSMGVISQETASGVRVVGAGSFPVSRRMPFVEEAFTDASRRLVQHARCVFFVGPLLGDEGKPHALTRLVDLPILVDSTASSAPGPIVVLEESIAAEARGEVLCVRLDPRVQPPAREPEGDSRTDAPPARPPAAEEKPGFEPLGAAEVPGPVDVDPAPKFVRLEDTQVDLKRPRIARDEKPAPRRDEARKPSEERRAATLPYEEPRYSSLIPRIAVSAVAILVIAFIAWWFFAERGRDGNDLATTPQAAGTASGRSAGEVMDDATAPAGQDPMVAADADTTTVAVPRPGGQTRATGTATDPTAKPTNGGGRSGGTVLIDSANIIIMDDLSRDWAGWFVVHISSFRGSVKARQEVGYLESQEFPVFIVFLDLGAKGKWYRVYAGPFRERGAARDVKKNLDDLQRVRFTRISEVKP